MRVKGFGRNYFSLSAICAFASATTLHAQTTALTQSSRNLYHDTLQEEEEEPLLEIELLENSPLILATKACHCNCFFKRLVYTLTQRLRVHPQTYFIFQKTRTGISPPHYHYQLTH